MFGMNKYLTLRASNLLHT